MIQDEDIKRINKVKDAEFAVPDGGAFIFIMPDEKQIEIDFQLLAEWFCLRHNIKIDWEAG